MTEPSRWLLVSDVDDTLLGDDAALAHLAQAWASTPHLIVAYNSSRPCPSLRKSLANVPQLPTPDYLIGGLGTEIQEGVSGQFLTDYTRQLEQGWHRDQIVDIIKEMGFMLHSAEYQTPLKASFDVPNGEAYAEAARQLKEVGLQAKLIFSGSKNLDIIPTSAGKGTVIDYLHQWLGISAQNVIVAGDSGNDVDMFVPPYRGIVVGNADADLKRLQGSHIYHAQAFQAGGVLEGLRYWKVL